MGFFNFNGGGGSSVVKTATVTLTDAQIKALPSGDFNIIPPVTSSQLLVPSLAIISGNIAGVYTNVQNDASARASGLVWFRNGGSPLCPIDLAGPTGLLHTGTFYWQCGPMPNYQQRAQGVITGSPDALLTPALEVGVVSGSNVELSNGQVAVPQGVFALAGDALDLHVGNGALGDFTGGNAANTLKVTVLYSVLDV
jgi:hypothetical protein